jgi:hypothetical protein
MCVVDSRSTRKINNINIYMERLKMEFRWLGVVDKREINAFNGLGNGVM